jgi:L-iditol 2-dehydrogenase
MGSISHNGGTVTNGVLKTSHKNPSLKVTADHQIKMEEAPVRQPGPGEVLLHVKATGICGYVRHQTLLWPLTKIACH